MTIAESSTNGKPVAVVTGASSGIGRALASEFARNGFDVLLVAEDDGLEAAASEVRGWGANVDVLQADLATFEGVEQLAGTIEQSARPVEAIAINAGVGVGGAFTDTDVKAELALIDLNVKSTVHLTKHIVPYFLERHRGRILFTSSVAALQPDPFEAVYGASKAFVRHFAESLRAELKDTGVTITILMPGPTETNFFNRAGMNDTKVGSDQKDDPNDVARQGVRALLDGKDSIVAGSLKTKAQTAVVTAVPTSVKGELHRRMAEPGTAKT